MMTKQRSKRHRTGKPGLATRKFHRPPAHVCADTAVTVVVAGVEMRQCQTCTHAWKA